MAMSEGVSVLNLLAGLVLGLLAGGWITALRMRQRLAEEQAQAVREAVDEAVDLAVAGAVEQPHAQLRFHVGNRVADGRLHPRQLARGGAETAGVGDGGKHA